MPSSSNVIEFFDIEAGGTAADFGDLTQARQQVAGASEANGGLNDGYQGSRNTYIQGSGRTLNLGGQADADRIGFFNVNTLGNESDFGSLAGNQETGGS